jgi:hypothetical protein
MPLETGQRRPASQRRSSWAVCAPASGLDERNHHLVNAMIRSTLTSGELGAHNGLPVTIIATATLEDLQAKTGVAHTGGGTVLPMSDVIRMAAHSFTTYCCSTRPNAASCTKVATAAWPPQRSGSCCTPLEHELVVAAHLLGLVMRGSVRSTMAPGK